MEKPLSPAPQRKKTWKCYLGLFLICWAVERWREFTAVADDLESPPTASESFKLSRTRLEI